MIHIALVSLFSQGKVGFRLLKVFVHSLCIDDNQEDRKMN